jgi:hypothetical protein
MLAQKKKKIEIVRKGKKEGAFKFEIKITVTFIDYI